MRSEGSRFTGGVGVKLCSLEVVQPSATVRTRPQASATSQPFATVRNRSCEGRMAVPIGSFPGVVIFGRFTCHVASFRVAGVALRDMWTCLATC